MFSLIVKKFIKIINLLYIFYFKYQVCILTFVLSFSSDISVRYLRLPILQRKQFQSRTLRQTSEKKYPLTSIVTTRLSLKANLSHYRLYKAIIS